MDVSNIKAINLEFYIVSQQSHDWVLPTARGGFINADRLVGLSQVDNGFIIVLNNAIIDAFVCVGEKNFVVMIHRFPDRFLRFFLADVFTFHTSPLSEKVLGLSPDDSNVQII